jgi:wyosine [tRNA(Phe)-imidazoG37] synthetase (radical SAM superfamily)
MGTFLFEEIIFGPIKSRRLGVSLGVNLLPEDYKYCTYDCLYCECGWTLDNKTKLKLHSREEIAEALDSKLAEMKADNQAPDNITFAGNGEPTVHPDFASIIDDTIALRDKYFPDAKISVLSNATQIHKKSIVEALNKVDQNILKLDSAIDNTYQLINRPKAKINVSTLVERMKVFNGNLSIQTLFVRGNYKGEHFDNTTDNEVNKWLELLKIINPKNVMIYPIDRDTPHSDLEKIDALTLDKIGEKVKDLGFEVHIYH